MQIIDFLVVGLVMVAQRIAVVRNMLPRQLA
jgi:hypothetical protein